MRSERHFVVEDKRGERIVVFRRLSTIASSETELRRIATETHTASTVEPWLASQKQHTSLNNRQQVFQNRFYTVLKIGFKSCQDSPNAKQGSLI
jgi:hypothetical protein